MLTLIKIEWLKIFKSKLTKLCCVILVLIMAGMIITEYQDMQLFKNSEAYQNEVLSWQEREQNLITYATESLEDPWYNDLQKEQIRRRIEIAAYRLEHDLPKDIYKNVWWFFNDNAFEMISTVVVVMTIIIGSINLALEYTTHTLRQVLLLPYKRWKILLSKFIAILLAGLLLYGILFVMGLGSGFIIHGTNGLSAQIILYMGDALTTMNMSVYSIIIVLLNLIKLAFYTAFVILLAVWTKNATATTIIASGFVLLSGMIGNFLASYYSFVNYLPFMNLDFRRYLDFGTTMPTLETFGGSYVIEGITPLISASIVFMTIVIFIGISFIGFKRQDI